MNKPKPAPGARLVRICGAVLAAGAAAALPLFLGPGGYGDAETAKYRLFLVLTLGCCGLAPAARLELAAVGSAPLARPKAPPA